MIRVTFVKDYQTELKTKYFETFRKSNDIIYDYQFYEWGECRLQLKEDDIVKIEKQVKDLTIEEMNILGISANMVWYSRKEKEEIEEVNGLTLYDYIDITKLVKGE